VKNALKSKFFSDLNEHRRIFNEERLRGLYLGYVESMPEDVHVGFAGVNEAGRDEVVS
jgi:hypothetical protein